jgi:prevent-host-death family protein
LRQQTSRVLKRVVAGEIVEITEHGHPIARIVPLRPGVLDQLTAEGRATEADSDLLGLLDELSSGCPPPQATTTPAAPGGTSQRPAFETSTPEQTTCGPRRPGARATGYTTSHGATPRPSQPQPGRISPPALPQAA